MHWKRKIRPGVTMLDLYTWKTANCQKVNIAVCELGLDFALHAIDISAGIQKSEDYLTLNPNGKVPTLYDRDADVTIFESGAILLYLAEKTGKLGAPTPKDRWALLQWVMWQMSSIGPIGGQLTHFQSAPERAPYALDRFRKEFDRLMQVLDGALAGQDYLLAGYSVADISIWPWVSRFEKLGITLGQYPNVLRWYLNISARPQVQRGFALLNSNSRIPIPLEADRSGMSPASHSLA